MKLKFTHLLPILMLVMIFYEFYTQGFTIDASVNKLLLGIVYGILLYILVYIIRAVGIPLWKRIRGKQEKDVPKYVEP